MCFCEVERCVVPLKNDGQSVGNESDSNGETNIEGEKREANVADSLHEDLSKHEEEMREEDWGESLRGEDEENGRSEKGEDEREREEKTD